MREESAARYQPTFQNYFRSAKALRMTGTAGRTETEAAEFERIYKAGMTVIPTHKQMLGWRNPDVCSARRKKNT